MSDTLALEKNKLLVRSLYEDCFNTGNLEVMTELIADDFIVNPGGKDASEFARSIVALRNGFPDIRFQIEDLFGEGDRIAVRWMFEATHRGPFAGAAPSLTRVTQTGNVLYQIREGKIIRAWVQVDRLGLMHQIGALQSSVASA